MGPAVPVLVVVLLTAYPIGALAALAIRGAVGRGLVAACAFIGALAVLGLGAVCLGAGLVPAFTASFLPLTGFTLRIDGLSAFFLIVIGVVGGAVAELYRPTQDLSIDFHPASKYFVQSIEYRSEIHPWFERMLDDPLRHALRTAATWTQRLQGGSLYLYLVYMTFALLVLPSVARWWR